MIYIFKIDQSISLKVSTNEIFSEEGIFFFTCFKVFRCDQFIFLNKPSNFLLCDIPINQNPPSFAGPNTIFDECSFFQACKIILLVISGISLPIIIVFLEFFVALTSD